MVMGVVEPTTAKGTLDYGVSWIFFNQGNSSFRGLKRVGVYAGGGGQGSGEKGCQGRGLWDVEKLRERESMIRRAHAASRLKGQRLEGRVVPTPPAQRAEVQDVSSMESSTPDAEDSAWQATRTRCCQLT